MATPRGPRAVRSALVDAAVDLFASTGTLSMRSVARRAGVNHGLIHHYLGGKSGLHEAMLDRAVSAVYDNFDAAADGTLEGLARAAVTSTRQDPRFVRVLTRVLLDEGPEGLVQSRFPVVERARAASPHPPEATDAIVALGLALGLGAVVFGPWIRLALGMDRATFDELVDRTLQLAYTFPGLLIEHAKAP